MFFGRGGGKGCVQGAQRIDMVKRAKDFWRAFVFRWHGPDRQEYRALGVKKRRSA